MAYLTAGEFAAITGQTAPEDFIILESAAAEAVDALTLYGYVGRDVASLPPYVQQKLKAAVAFQVMHLNEIGLAGANEPGMGSVSLGKFSYSSARGDGSSGNAPASGALAPLAQRNIPFLLAYMRGVL